MNSSADYCRATNMAYEALSEYAYYGGGFPKIDIFMMLHLKQNIIVKTFGTLAEKMEISLPVFIYTYSPSEYGFTIKDKKTNNSIICFNENKDVTTTRFTLAHELGHILLEHDDDDDISNKEANCFARNLLCPIPVVDNSNVSYPEDYVKYFDISYPMAEAAFDLRKNDTHYITDGNYRLIEYFFNMAILGFDPVEVYGIGAN